MDFKKILFTFIIISPIACLILLSSMECELVDAKVVTKYEKVCYPVDENSYKLATGKIDDLPSQQSAFGSSGPNIQNTHLSASFATTAQENFDYFSSRF